MIRRRPLKTLFYANVLVVLFLVGYKAYLNFFKADFEAVHATQLARLEEKLQDRESFSFAVVGNINNSVGIFERKIIPVLNSSGVDFLVSAGNAVSGGGEDKYRALYGTLGRLSIPYLLTFGENEAEGFGGFRFYEHFGPHFYYFDVSDSRLIFLDSTGKTPHRWQIRWLRNLLSDDSMKHVFIFIGKPLFRDGPDMLFVEDEDYLQPGEFRQQLLALADEYHIDAVFSANLPIYSRRKRDETDFVTTGGAGDLILNNDTSFYHYIRIVVTPKAVDIEMVPLEIGQHPVFRQLESIWFFIYSLFYVGYLNFILLVSLFIIFAIYLHNLVFVGRDFYPNYNIDPEPWLNRKLSVAMFTNNYLPFIGGVPISIERLRRGLESLGDRVLVVAPRYRRQPAVEENTLRVPSLLALGDKREFRMANIFLPRTGRRVRKFGPDIIHLHHPFWLGSLGLFLARRIGVPAVYTYHTRLEHYAHYVPLPGSIFRNLISHALIKRFTNRCDGVIVPTYSVEEYLRMIGVRSPVYVQPTGIEYERFQEVDGKEVGRLKRELGLQDKLVLVSVSRLTTEKNIDFMIDAVHELRGRTNRPFHVLMIGEGQQRQRLQKRIDELGLGDHFTLPGAVGRERMPLYYRLGDLFVYTSISETQGMAILEAMAAGLPVVAVRSSGIDDIVRHGHNGYKTPEKRDRWAEAVAELMHDDELRNTFSGHAREFARYYSIERFAKNVKGIYAEVLAAAAYSKDSATETQGRG